MHPNAYRTLAQNEEQGWYYEARRRAVAALVERYVRGEKAGPRKPLNVVDVGCGTGGTTAFLRQFGHVTGVEPSPLAIDLLRERYPDLPVIEGKVDELSKLLPAHEFDLATIMGVLYCANVADPLAALKNVRRALRPGGWLIWSDAAYPFLARQHDRFVNAGRRFYPRQMKQLLTDAGFEVVDGSHMLAWGFPIALALATAYRVRSWFQRSESLAEVQDTSDDRPLPGWINRLLTNVTVAEWQLSSKRLMLPMGVSYLVIARKPVAVPAQVAVPLRRAA